MFNGFKSNAYKNHYGCTAESKTGHCFTEDRFENVRNGCDDSEEQRTDYRNSVNHSDNEIGCRFTGSDTGDCSAVILDIVRYLNRIVLNGDIEEVECNDKNKCENDVDRARGREVIRHELCQAAVREELRYCCRKTYYRISEDDGHNAGHCNLYGKECALAAVHLSAYLTFCVLYGNASFGAVHKYDERKHNKSENNKDGDYPPVAGLRLLNAVTDKADTARNDGSKKYYGDTVAYSLFVNAFAQPHNKHRACKQKNNEYRDTEPLGHAGGKVHQGGGVAVGHYRVITESLNKTYAYRKETSCVFKFLLSRFAAVFLQSFKCGNGNGKKLNDNGCVDVRLYRQRKECSVCKRVTGKHIEVTEQRAALRTEETLKCIRVNKRNGNVYTDSEKYYNKASKYDLRFEVACLPSISQGRKNIHLL